jgi:excisionase family DNA binding protein
LRSELQSALELARTLGFEELPRLLGDLEEIRTTALTRVALPTKWKPEPPDELLNVAEAAARLNCSKQFLYRNANRLPFTRRNAVGRSLRFSAAALDAYLKLKRS